MLISHNDIHIYIERERERDRQVEGAGKSSLCGASLWRNRDPVHWRQKSWLKQFSESLK